MRKQTWNRFLVMAISILLVCTVCFAASAENAGNSDFEINGTTLVKYKGNGGEVTVPDGIEVLGREAFNNAGITKVNLPETLKTIENHCFMSCRGLEEITLPASLEGLENVIQPFMFSGLKEFKTAEGGNYKAVDGVLFTADGKTLVCYPPAKADKEYSIPEGTERLGQSPFDELRAETLIIPSTLTDMETRFNIFRGSSDLQEFIVSPDNKQYYSVGRALYTGNRLIAYPAEKHWNKLKPTDFPAGLKEIGPDAFCSNDLVESVELPEGVEVVGDMAFVGMKRLKTVVVPASVKEIGCMAFVHCENLERVTVLNPDVNILDAYRDRDPKLYNLLRWDDTTNAVICGYAGGKLQEYAAKCGLNFEALEAETGEAVETAAEEKPADYNSEDFRIEDTVLVKYKGAGGEVTVPDGITMLESSAFEGSTVTKVHLPESLKTIGSHCFFGCSRLTEITLPASLEGLEWETQPFGYSGLREFKTAEGGNYKAVDGVLFTADGKTLVCYPPAKADREYTIPEGTESLGQSPFDELRAETVNIPSTLTNMGMEYNVFVGSSNLRNINVSPENKKYYSVDGVLYTGNRLVYYPTRKANRELKPEDFPAGLKEIGDDSFWGNEYLVNVELPEGIEIVGGKSLIDMELLKTLRVPASVKEIGFLAFTGNKSLEKVTILNPDVNILEGHGDYDPKEYNLLRWADTTNAVICGYPGGTLQAYAEERGLKFEALDPEAEKEAETAQPAPATAEKKPLEYNSEDFTVEGTTLVNYHGPGGEVTVPDGIETLGEWTFSGSGVTKVNLPESLKTIDYYCFHSCDTLEEITIPASVVDIMETQAFAYNTNLKAIHVAEGNPCYTSVDGVLFTGNGQKLLYYPAGKNRGGKYAIPEGTVSLGRTAFEGTGLTAVTLPSSLVTLEGGNDFSSNYELEEIRVAEGNPRFRSIDGMLFDQAGKLLCYPAGRKTEIMGANEFPAEMTAIGPWAFQHVQHLKSITVPNGIKTIDWMCFTWAKSLESVILPASVDYIAGYAFADCPELRQVVILNPDAHIVLDDERFSDDYRAKMNFNIVDESPKAVLYGYEGSTAQEYAGLRDDTFVSLGQGPARNTDAAAEPGERQVVPGCAQ